MDKQKLKDSCFEKLYSQISEFQELINEVQTASNNETKSTAGDKHDTARAQAQIEVERLSKQLAIMKQMQSDLSKINTERSKKIALGSFIKTNVGNFYVSVALGKMYCEEFEFFAISDNSPLFLNFKGLVVGDEFLMVNKNKGCIHEIF
jgi:hypothetical protein